MVIEASSPLPGLLGSLVDYDDDDDDSLIPASRGESGHPLCKNKVGVHLPFECMRGVLHLLTAVLCWCGVSPRYRLTAVVAPTGAGVQSLLPSPAS